MRAIAIILGFLIVTSCVARPSGPPAVLLDQTACSRCHMLISDLAFAASLRSADGKEKTFDDIGCLIDELNRRTAAGSQSWIHDHAAQRWIAADKAIFVIAADVRAPMGGHVVAFGGSTAANAFAGTHGGRVLTSLPLLLSAKGTH